MIEFPIEPDRIGTFENDRPRYNVEVPLKGEPLVPCDFVGLTPPEVVAEMLTRMDRFNTEEKSQKYDPSTWFNVGYYIHPPSIVKQSQPKQYIGEPADPLVGTLIANPDFGKITAYYQVKTSVYREPPQQWLNWPFRDPKVYGPE